LDVTGVEAGGGVVVVDGDAGGDTRRSVKTLMLFTRKCTPGISPGMCAER
jgi:hypothetical protein